MQKTTKSAVDAEQIAHIKHLQQRHIAGSPALFSWQVFNTTEGLDRLAPYCHHIQALLLTTGGSLVAYGGCEMKGLTLEAAHQEIVSLVHRGVEEFEEGEIRAGASLFLEAQFLLGEVVQNQLNHLHSTPPLIPAAEDCADEESCHLLKAE